MRSSKNIRRVGALAHSLRSNRPQRLIVVLLLALFVASCLRAFANKSALMREPDLPTNRLILLIPATQADTELCKCLLTSHILGYPSPVLINWNKTAETGDHHWRANGTHIAKITGIEVYLNSRPRKEDSDIVLIVDGYDTWFQLPPEVLLARYQRIAKDNAQRTREHLGSKLAESIDMHESILFSAEKGCGPTSAVDWDISKYPMCYAVPPSPLRHDLYGAVTDHWLNGNLSNYMRPKYLNSGFVMGRVNHVRQMMTRAHRLVHSMDHGGSDQLIFGRLFGEQWYFREAMGARSRSVLRRLAISMQKFFRFYQPSSIELAADAGLEGPSERLSTALELGMSLDYGLELVNTAVWSEFDGRFLVHNTTEDLYRQQLAVGVNFSPRVKAPLSRELSNARRPFELLNSSEDASATTPWSEVPLYTNIYTANVPAVIHMNGAKIMRNVMWQDFWPFEKLRGLLIGRAQSGDVGAFSDNGTWIRYEDICQGTDAEVFRDGLEL